MLNDSFQKMTSYEIYDSFNVSLNKIYNKYYYYFMNTEKYKKYVVNEIDKTCNNYNSNMDYEKFINNRLIEKSKVKVK